MVQLKYLIRNLRLYSFLLFFLPSIALLGSLLIANHLNNFKFYSYAQGKTDARIIECSKENNFCKNIEKQIKFHECSKYIVTLNVIIDGTFWKFDSEEHLKQINENKNFKYVITHNYEKIDHSCIKNSIFYPIYKTFPLAVKIFTKFKNKASFATSEPVFPFFYGETSISNIAKRFPQSYLFKPLLYLSTFFMILYWINYQRIFTRLENKKKISKFLIFGIASSLFLFLHVLFLGFDIGDSIFKDLVDNSLFKKIRRFIIVAFIASELAAQFFLIRRIFIIKNILSIYTYKFIIYLKLIFVASILLITAIAILIYILSDPGHTFNNVLEWNYFIFLLVFYIFSVFLWRGEPPVHTPEGM